MSVLISHDSALEYWRSVPPQVDTSTEIPTPLPSTEYSTTARDLAAFDAAAYGITQKPLHVLGGNDVRRSSAADVKPHTCSLAFLPPSSVRALEPHVYVSGPELAFAQMSRSLGEMGAALLGFELCGDYSHFSAPISGFYDRPALTDTARMAQVFSQLKGPLWANVRPASAQAGHRRRPIAHGNGPGLHAFVPGEARRVGIREAEAQL